MSVRSRSSGMTETRIPGLGWLISRARLICSWVSPRSRRTVSAVSGTLGTGVVQVLDDGVLGQQRGTLREGDQHLLADDAARLVFQIGDRRRGRVVDRQPAEAGDGGGPYVRFARAEQRTTGGTSASFHSASVCSSAGSSDRPGIKLQSGLVAASAATRTFASGSARPETSRSWTGRSASIQRFGAGSVPSRSKTLPITTTADARP